MELASPRPLTEMRNRQSTLSVFALIVRKLLAEFTAQLQQNIIIKEKIL